MLSSGVLFVAISTALQTFVVYSDPTPEIDFRTILELAGHALKKDRQPAQELKYEFASREDYNSQFGSLSSREILELIQKSTNDKGLVLQSDKNEYREFDDRENEPAYRYNYKKNDDAETFGHYDRNEVLNDNKEDLEYKHELDLYNRDKYKEEDERYRDSRFNQLALEELLTQNVQDDKYKNRPRKRVIPNNLVGSYLNNDKSQNSNNVDGYSKVYVILNPKAIQKSKNKDELNNLLVKILSLTASSLGREQGKKINEYRYKGFPVKTGLLTRRARRDSRDMYAGKDSVEDDYKPKRSRNDRGSGGGGGLAGGRTAIPYIRHRGDIYERDN